MIKETISDFLLSHGAGQVGFCRLTEENEFHLTYAISFTIPLSNAIVDSIQDAPTHTYFHHYRTVNTLIDSLSLRVGRMLAEAGYRYVPVPASQSVAGLQGIFPHKTAACLAGLGSMGKSGLFLSDKYGPRVRLGTILTDCPLSDTVSCRECSCGNCTICRDACPAMAITGQLWTNEGGREQILDARACSEYMKQHFQHIGRGAVCGICMQVCPKGKNHAKTC